MMATASHRGDMTRQRLLEAAVEVFARDGFQGATTRRLTEAAGVNQQAIPYYFGGKQNLYMAVVDHIARQIDAMLDPLHADIETFLKSGTSTPEAAAGWLTSLIEALARIYCHPESMLRGSIIAHEQFNPTTAHAELHRLAMRRIHENACDLLSLARGETRPTEEARMASVSLVGSVLIFLAGRASVLRVMEWKDIGQSEAARIEAHATDLVQLFIRPPAV